MLHSWMRAQEDIRRRGERALHDITLPLADAAILRSYTHTLLLLTYEIPHKSRAADSHSQPPRMNTVASDSMRPRYGHNILMALYTLHGYYHVTPPQDTHYATRWPLLRCHVIWMPLRAVTPRYAAATLRERRQRMRCHCRCFSYT